MENKILGIIESVNDEKKIVNLLGYGEYLGTFPVMDDEFGLEIDTPKVRMEDGSELFISNVCFFSDKESIEESMSDYKNKGYQINHVKR